MAILRSLRREPGVALVVILSVAVAVAANATVFSLLQAVEFPHLIYPRSAELVQLGARNLPRDLSELPLSYPDAVDVRTTVHSLSQVSITRDRAATWRGADRSDRVSGREVDAAFFPVLGSAPEKGRTLGDDSSDADMVVSQSFWRGQLGADVNVLGRVVDLDGRRYTVVGLMPARFDSDADFWITLPPDAAASPRDDRNFTVFGRLRDGTTLQALEADLDQLSTRLSTEHAGTNASWGLFPVELRHVHGRDSRGLFSALQGLVLLVLLIACANIANILLARGVQREHETALRVALGASRGRVLRQMLGETLVLAFAGGAAGVILTLWGVALARTIMPPLPETMSPDVNLYVLAFSLVATAATGVLCGILPAWRASRAAPQDVLGREGGRSRTGSAWAGRVRAGLVAAQVAGAVALGTSALLLAQSLMHGLRADLGFVQEGAIQAQIDLSGQDHSGPVHGSQDTATADRQRALTSTVIDRVAAQPEVMAAGASAFGFPVGVGAQLVIARSDQPDDALPSGVRRGIDCVTPDYFRAMGISITSGRAFQASDRFGAAPVAIVNEELARHLFPGRDPLGQSLRLGRTGASPVIATVVGVAGSIRRSALHSFVVARAYVPYDQFPGPSLTMVVRGRTDTGAAARALRAGLHDADPWLVAEEERTVAEDEARFLQPIRMTSTLLAIFAVAGLFLAALGVFGTVSYAVSQRESEFAVRSALGADPRDLLRLVLGSGLGLALAGIIPGTGLALLSARLVASLLLGVSPSDPSTLAVAGAVVLVISAFACWGPARRAAAVDPAAVLQRRTR